MKPEPIRILLVEDEEQLREMLLMTLEDEGYEVVGAPSGEQALQEALNSSFDLVIADVKLTGMDGLDTLSELKKGHSELQSMVITGYATEADSIRAISLGVGHYMKKPFKLQDFLRAVSEISAQIGEARKEARLREKINQGCLWILERLCLSELEGQRGSQLVDLASSVERTLLARRHSEKVARELRLALLCAALGDPLLESQTPFLPDMLAVQVGRFQASLAGSDEGQGEEIGIARRALEAWLDGSDRITELLQTDTVSSPVPEVSDAQDAGRLLALAKALEASGDRDSAAKVLSRIEEHLISEISLVYLNKAHLAWGEGERQAARTHLERAEKEARGVAERARVHLEGGILYCRLNQPQEGLDWLRQAEDGLRQLGNRVDRARAKLALGAFSEEPVESDPDSVDVLLEPNNLEQLFQSGEWLFPFLLSQNCENASVRRLAVRLVRNMPNLVLSKMKMGVLPDSSLLRGLEIINEVGTELYEEALEELILQGGPELRSRATSMLREGSEAQFHPTLRLYSLGMQRTWVGERLIPDKGWSGTKPRLLLTYLSQNPDQFLSQDHIVDLFWDGSSKGKRNLNQTLVVIRQNLRLDSDATEIDYIQRRGSTLGLNPDLPHWHDAAVVRSLLEQGQKHVSAQRTEEAATCFDQALQLDRGEYLDGHYEDWVLTYRTGLRRDLDLGGQALADIRLQQNRPSEALAVAQHLLTYDPFSEASIGTLMRSYAALKNPVEALKRFEAFEARLKREMELEPTMDLVRLYHEIKLAM